MRAWAKASGVPVVDCKAGERKHLIAERHLATWDKTRFGVFLVLVARAPVQVFDVQRNSAGVICNLAKKKAFVNHYSFHIYDPEWGHVTIKLAGHPPFDAQIMLNGHEFVAAAAADAAITFRKEGNCFTSVPDPQTLAQVADTLSSSEAVGRLVRVCREAVVLQLVPVLCPRLRGATHLPVPLQLVGLPGRVLPQLAVPLRCPTRRGVQPDRRQDPQPPRRAAPQHPLRVQEAPAPGPQRRTAPHRGRDRDPGVRPHRL